MAEPLLDAPIPGQSLTAPLGGRPWQSPPQFPTVDDATDFYISRMSTPEFSSQLAEVLEMGIPATTIANTLQMGNVMEGKHTIDVGMLVLPLIVEMIMFIAESEGVEYDDGLTEVKDNKTNDAVLENIRRKMKKQVGKEEEPIVKVEEKEEMPTGLMARRTQ